MKYNETMVFIVLQELVGISDIEKIQNENLDIFNHCNPSSYHKAIRKFIIPNFIKRSEEWRRLSINSIYYYLKFLPLELQDIFDGALPGFNCDVDATEFYQILLSEVCEDYSYLANLNQEDFIESKNIRDQFL